MSAFEDGFDDLLAPPELPACRYASIPEELKNSKSWLTYKYEPRPDGKKNKIPYDPNTGKKANNPALGITFEEAKKFENKYDGLGFYVESPYIVIDIDGCVNPTNGDVELYAAEIVQELNSYTEASPSGTGLHIWVRGVKPGEKCRKGIEIYSTKRFLTVTGVHVPVTPKEIRAVDITALYNRMLAEAYSDENIQQHSAVDETESGHQKLTTEIQSSGNVLTTKLQLLMRGEIFSLKPFTIGDQYGNDVTYPSQSEADGALACLLAIEHKGDAAAIDGDFRISSLYRPKWDRVDYRDATIKSAIAWYKRTQAIKEPPNTPQTATAAVQETEDEEIIDVDTKLPEFPAFTGTLAELCDAMSPDIPRAFKFCAALTHMGIIRSGFDTLAVEPHIQPRFYTSLIAQPGRGKSAAINEVGRIFKNVSGAYQAWPSIDSGPALVDAFDEQRRASIIKADGTDNLMDSTMAKILLAPDELKGLFEKAKITTGSRNTMLDEILKLYEGNTTGSRVRGAKIKIKIECAHLGVLGGATDSGYASMWTGTGGGADGLQSRFIPIGIEDHKMPAVQRRPDLERITALTQELIDQAKQPAMLFEMDEDALQLYTKWWEKKDQAKASETRIDGVVKRLVIILARTNDAEIIDAEMMQQAVDFGDFVIAARDKYNPLDASTWVQAFENLVIAQHQIHGNMTPNKCRKRCHPERRPGGVGPFLQAYKNLQQSQVLAVAGTTQRGNIYRLSL
jgi:putative DNA primase/helicase